MTKIARQNRVNREITAPTVRVVGETGDQLGIMSLRDALALAQEQGLDLIEIAPQSAPPVCRIADYGKLRYEASKRERKAKAGQRGNEVKEIRFRPNIGDNDLEAKEKKIREFIAQGNKVKLTVRFRGREIARQQSGLELLRRIAGDLKEEVRLERQPESQGRSLTLVLIPTRK